MTPLTSYRCTHCSYSERVQAHCQTRTWNTEESLRHLRKKHRWDYFPLGKKLCSSEKFLSFPWHRISKTVSKLMLFCIPLTFLSLCMGWNSFLFAIQGVMTVTMVITMLLGHPFLMNGCPCCSREYWKEPEMVREVYGK